VATEVVLVHNQIQPCGKRMRGTVSHSEFRVLSSRLGREVLRCGLT
jgi:hypothetical protein